MGQTQVKENRVSKVQNDDKSSKKSVYFIRHGEATHNIGFELHGENAYLSEEYVNAPLTTKGIYQAKRARKELEGKASGKAIRLVFTSPLTRTIETTLAMFGEDKIALNALDELRETGHLHPCDKREDKQVIAAKYPMLNVDRLTDSDEWFGSPFPPQRFEILKRILEETEENPIAVVSHHDALIQFFKFIGYRHDGGIQNCQIIHIEM